MKLHLTRPEEGNLFTGYGADYVAIAGQRYQHAIVVAPGRPVERWEASDFDSLSAAHFAALAALEPELVLLGTGERLRWPSPALMQPLAAAAIGFEAMDTRAACRTYNILVAEGRQVLAAILV